MKAGRHISTKNGRVVDFIEFDPEELGLPPFLNKIRLYNVPITKPEIKEMK